MATRRGYVMLLSVLVVGTLGLAIALGSLSVGSAAAQSGSVLEQAAKARALADGCAELALLHAEQCSPAEQSWQTADGTCTATMTRANGNRTIRAQGTAGSSFRRVSAAVRFVEETPPTVAWQETAD